jgi:hypothetical protein
MNKGSSNQLILSILMMEAINSSETLVLTRTTQNHTPRDDILHSHRRGNLNLRNFETLSTPFLWGTCFVQANLSMLTWQL